MGGESCAMTDSGECGHGPGDMPLPGGGVFQPPVEAGDTDLPTSFSTLLQPFYLMGLAGLGLVPDPESQQPKIRLAVARHAIAALELLKARTAENLSESESRLLDEVIHGLKLQYVEVRERIDRT